MMLNGSLFENHVDFRQISNVELENQSKLLYLNCVEMYIKGQLVYLFGEGSLKELKSSYLYSKVKAIEEGVKKDIELFCEKQGLSLEFEENIRDTHGYYNTFTIRNEKTGDKFNILLRIGEYLSEEDKQSALKRHGELTEVKGVFENNQFVY